LNTKSENDDNNHIGGLFPMYWQWTYAQKPLEVETVFTKLRAVIMSP